MITSLGCEAVERASAIARQADIVAALTLEVLKGTTKAFDTGQWILPISGAPPPELVGQVGGGF